MAERQVEERQLDKLLIEVYPSQKFDRLDDELVALFNPTEYTFTRSNAWNAKTAKGTSRPSTSFGHGNPDKMSLTLFLDGTGVVGDAGPVTGRLNDFLDLMRYRGDNHKPRYLRLRWGWLDFRCVLTDATVTLVLFDRSGEPLRARIAASFQEVIEERERINEERSSSPDLFQVWEVEEGDTLDGIAHRVYGDPAWWRPVAEVNGLENPRSLVAGQRLTLPPAER